MVKDYAIIYNPTSANGKSKKDFDLAVKYLTDMDVKFNLFKTEYMGHGISLSEQLAKDGYRIIGAGGDGTCNEVMNGAMKSNTNALVGFIPMGSGNDIPGAIGYQPDIKRACEVIASGTTGRADVGLSIGKTGEKRYFLGIGSQGFDAEVTKKSNANVKKYNGTMNYYVMVLKTVFKYRKRGLRVTMDNDIYEGIPNCVAVGNPESYGGWMFLCMQARVDDGLFNISIPDLNPLKLILDFGKMYSKTVLPHPKIKTYQSKKVRIEMIDLEDEPCLAQVDGELIGDLPVTYECLPNAYEFIKPERDETLDWFMKKYGKKYLKHCKKHNLTPKMNE